MQVIVQAKTLPVTAALRAFVERQAQKLVKFGVKITKVRVYMENVARKTSDPRRSEVRYKVEVPGKDLVVEKKGNDLYVVVTEATTGVMRQLARLKEKHLGRKRHTTTETNQI
jgi:putative sigma-54 modulation protein